MQRLRLMNKSLHLVRDGFLVWRGARLTPRASEATLLFVLLW